MLIDPKLGHFGPSWTRRITNMRTGAQTAVALKYMFQKEEPPARPLRRWNAGAYPWPRLFDIREVKVYDVNAAAAERYAKDMKDTVKGENNYRENAKEAADADVCVCVTPVKRMNFSSMTGSSQECSSSPGLLRMHQRVHIKGR